MLAEELHKPMTKKFNEGKSRCEYSIWPADLAEMGSLSSKNQGVKCLLCCRCFHQISLS